MWPANKLTDQLGIDVAIIQSPMAGAGTPALSAAVSNAGGLGSLGLGTIAPDAAAAEISDHIQLSNRSLNANFFCHDEPGDVSAGSEAMRGRIKEWFDARELGPVPAASVPYATFGPAHVEMIQTLQPKVISFHFGLPERPLYDAVRETGATILCSATTVAEARWLESQGVDAIIAQGTEAGGHRGTFQNADITAQPGLFALLPQITAAVDLPVIAAGGIVDGRTIAAALIMGASAVQLGTAFLRCPETKIHPAHRKALAAARDDGTRLTKLFSGKPARSLTNRYMETFADAEAKTAPYPAQISLAASLKQASPEADIGDVSSLWSGQSAALTREMPAAELLDLLVAETDEVLNALAKR